MSAGRHHFPTNPGPLLFLRSPTRPNPAGGGGNGFAHAHAPQLRCGQRALRAKTCYLSRGCATQLRQEAASGTRKAQGRGLEGDSLWERVTAPEALSHCPEMCRSELTLQGCPHPPPPCVPAPLQLHASPCSPSSSATPPPGTPTHLAPLPSPCRHFHNALPWALPPRDTGLSLPLDGDGARRPLHPLHPQPQQSGCIQ